MTVFGFLKGRNSEYPSLNGKLSEYAAAVGLAALDVYPAMRKHYSSLRDRYITLLAKYNIRHRLSSQWISATCNLVVPGQVQYLASVFTAQNIETRSWWEQGCHRHTAYQHCPKGALEVTERLVKAAFGVPFFFDMTEQHFARVEEILSSKEAVQSESTLQQAWA
jgi:dTDP-4-amino-4,6-dideoxygalactose transaminase